MKKQVLLLLSSLFLCMAAPRAADAMNFTFFGIPIANLGEHVARVEKLPKTPDYSLPSGKKEVHVDLGIYHSQFSILGIPLLNWGKKTYVFYHTSLFGGTQYVKLTDEAVEGLNKSLGLNIPKEPKLSFWHRWGGKLLVLIPVLFIVAVSRS